MRRTRSPSQRVDVLEHPRSCLEPKRPNFRDSIDQPRLPDFLLLVCCYQERRPRAVSHNRNMGENEKQTSKRDEKKKAPSPVRVTRKIGEPPGNLRKREQWFRKRSGS